MGMTTWRKRTTASRRRTVRTGCCFGSVGKAFDNQPSGLELAAELGSTSTGRPSGVAQLNGMIRSSAAVTKAPAKLILEAILPLSEPSPAAAGSPGRDAASLGCQRSFGPIRVEDQRTPFLASRVSMRPTLRLRRAE